MSLSVDPLHPPPSLLGLLGVLTALYVRVNAGLWEEQVEYVCCVTTLVCIDRRVQRGRREHHDITRWLGISRCPDRSVNTKHLLLLSSLNTHNYKDLLKSVNWSKLLLHIRASDTGWWWPPSCARRWLYSSSAWLCKRVSNFSLVYWVFCLFFK